MNPQFCPTFHVRPNFVPVVIRPTVPVGYPPPFDPPSQQYNIPVLGPMHLTPDGTFNPTTSKTRRELEQLGSPTEDFTEMIFKLAAQKNGIRIGTVPNKAGSAKQSDSLEDFKKIAQRNGITVCPPGLKESKSSSLPANTIAESGLTPVSTAVPQHGLSSSLTSTVNICKYSCTDKAIAEGENVCEAQLNAALFEAEVETEMNSNMNIVDLFKEKAAKRGITVQDVTDSLQNQSSEQNSIITGDCGAVTESTEGAFPEGNVVVKSETLPVTSKPDLTKGAVMSTSMDNTRKHDLALDNSTLSNPDSDIEPKIEDLKKETHESGMEDVTSDHDFQSSDLEKSVNNSAISEVCTSVTTSEDALAAENSSVVTTPLVKDAQVAAFQEIAHLKGIKVGDNKTCSDTSPCDGQLTAIIEAEEFAEYDEQIARFQEMARLNGIKVGDSNTRKQLSSDSFSEYIEPVMTENVLESEYYTDMCLYTYPIEQDPQIARFQELARLNGIKVNNSRSSSYSSVSTTTSEDHLCYPEDEIFSVAMHSLDKKGDIFEELAKRNGIKVGKKVVPSDSPIVKTSSVNGCGAVPLFGSVFSQASTQTEVKIVMDGCSQTREEDHGILKQTAGVQVSATKEAFGEEYLLWKVDDNASEDDVELCYKELYFDERKAREGLSSSLQNEKDMSANARHNHKRVMDQLKEELSSKSEEIEKLKKDLKTLKKHKETEIKRITKELKTKEEELESNKTTLQLKEVALEGLKSIAQEQTAKLKALEEQLEEMKTSLLETNNNKECKTCLERHVENKEDKAIRDTSPKEQGDGGWKLITGRKSKSLACMFKPTQNDKAQGVQQHGGVDELCDIDLTDPPCVHRQSVSEEPSDLNKQANNLGDVTCESGLLPQEPVGNDSVKDGATPPLSVTNTPVDTTRIQALYRALPSHLSPSPTEDKPNVSVLCDNSSVSQNQQQKLPNVADANAQNQASSANSTVQQQPHVLFPSTFSAGQPCQFPAIPPQVLSQYMSFLQMFQQQLPPGNGTPKSSVPLRPPPGLNTEPVPEGDVPEQTPSPPPPTPTGKFSSFDKLMDALQKRFPSKSRQELIIYLKQAKAASGDAGFKGKQIPEVVKCVESIVELEGRQESQDTQASPTDN